MNSGSGGGASFPSPSKVFFPRAFFFPQGGFFAFMEGIVVSLTMSYFFLSVPASSVGNNLGVYRGWLGIR